MSALTKRLQAVAGSPNSAPTYASANAPPASATSPGERKRLAPAEASPNSSALSLAVDTFSSSKRQRTDGATTTLASLAAQLSSRPRGTSPSAQGIRPPLLNSDAPRSRAAAAAAAAIKDDDEDDGDFAFRKPRGAVSNSSSNRAGSSSAAPFTSPPKASPGVVSKGASAAAAKTPASPLPSSIVGAIASTVSAVASSFFSAAVPSAVAIPGGSSSVTSSPAAAAAAVLSNKSRAAFSSPSASKASDEWDAVIGASDSAASAVAAAPAGGVDVARTVTSASSNGAASPNSIAGGRGGGRAGAAGQSVVSNKSKAGRGGGAIAAAAPAPVGNDAVTRKGTMDVDNDGSSVDDVREEKPGDAAPPKSHRRTPKAALPAASVSTAAAASRTTKESASAAAALPSLASSSATSAAGKRGRKPKVAAEAAGDHSDGGSDSDSPSAAAGQTAPSAARSRGTKAQQSTSEPAVAVSSPVPLRTRGPAAARLSAAAPVANSASKAKASAPASSPSPVRATRSSGVVINLGPIELPDLPGTSRNPAWMKSLSSAAAVEAARQRREEERQMERRALGLPSDDEEDAEEEEEVEDAEEEEVPKKRGRKGQQQVEEVELASEDDEGHGRRKGRKQQEAGSGRRGRKPKAAIVDGTLDNSDGDDSDGSDIPPPLSSSKRRGVASEPASSSTAAVSSARGKGPKGGSRSGGGKSGPPPPEFKWLGKPIRVSGGDKFYGAVCITRYVPSTSATTASDGDDGTAASADVAPSRGKGRRGPATSSSSAAATYVPEATIFRCGDFATFPVKVGRDEWVGRLDELWTDGYGEGWVKARWAYYPEETASGRVRGQHLRELLLTDHEDTNTIDTLSGIAHVVSEARFAALEAQYAPSSSSSGAGTGAGSSSPSSSPAVGGSASAADGTTPSDPFWERYRRDNGGAHLFFTRNFYDYRTKQFRPLLRSSGLTAPNADANADGTAKTTADYVSSSAGDSGSASSASAAAADARGRGRGGASASASLGTGTGAVKAGGGSASVAAALARARAAGAAARSNDSNSSNSESAPDGKGAGAGASSSSSSCSAAAASATSSASAASGAPSRIRSFVDLCREAQAKLQLSAVPDSLPCREGERKQVLDFLRKSIAQGGLGSALYISGMPGTGKTATVKEVVRVLEREHLQGSLPPFEFHEINAMRLATPHQAYSALWAAVSGGLHAAPKRAAELLDAHFNRPAAGKRCVVVLVDELDFLVTRKQSVLYNLFDWPTRRHARLVVIGIANTMDLPERLLPRVVSRLGLGRVVFKPYTRQQIVTILTARLQGLPAFEGGAIQLAAAQVANISGDVRKALQICRRAAEMAANRTLSAVASSSTSSSGAGAGAGSSSSNSMASSKASVGVQDITAAAKALSAGLTSQALLATRPWERLLLVALAAHLRDNVAEEGHVDAIFNRAAGYSRTMRIQYPRTAAGSSSNSSGASSGGVRADSGASGANSSEDDVQMSEARAGSRSSASGSSSAAEASAAATAGRDGSTFYWEEDDEEAVLLEGYRACGSEDDFLSIAHALSAWKMVSVDARQGQRRPFLRLNIQADDIRTVLRDDPLVKKVLVDGSS